MGGGAVGADAARGPESIDFREEGGDLTPACSFASFAGFPNEDDEEIEAVTGGPDEGVWGGSGDVAEGGEELEKESSGVGFAVRSEVAEHAAGEAVKGLVRERGRGRGVARLLELRGLFVQGGVWFFPGFFAGEGPIGLRGGSRVVAACSPVEQFTLAALYGG